MSHNQGRGDFMRGNRAGFQVMNRHVKHGSAQSLIMGDPHGHSHTEQSSEDFTEYQQFLEWKRMSGSSSMNSSVNSSSVIGECCDISHSLTEPAMTSTPVVVKTPKKKHKKRYVSSSSSTSSSSSSDSSSESEYSSDSSYERKRKKHSRKKKKKSHRRSRRKRRQSRSRSRSRSRTPVTRRSMSPKPTAKPSRSPSPKPPTKPSPSPKTASERSRSSAPSKTIESPKQSGVTVTPDQSTVAVTDKSKPKPKPGRAKKKAAISDAPVTYDQVVVKTEPGLSPTQENVQNIDSSDYLTVKIKKEDLRGFNVIEHEGAVLAERKPQPNRYVNSFN